MRAASILAALLGGGSLGHWGSDPLLGTATGSGNQRGQQRRKALGGRLVWDSLRRGSYSNPARHAERKDRRAARVLRKLHGTVPEQRRRNDARPNRGAVHG